MNRNERIRIKSDKLYPIHDTLAGYRYWVKTLVEKCIGMTKIEGLEEFPYIPEKECQLDLIVGGHFGIFEHKKFGLVENGGVLGGTPDAFYHPTEFIYAQPALGSGNLKIGDNVGVVYNMYTDVPCFNTASDAFGQGGSGLFSLIKRTAMLLADIEATIDILTWQRRLTNIPVASNEALASSVKAFFKSVRLGDVDCVNEQSILESLKTLPFDNGSRDSLTELYDLKRRVFKDFLAEIGVKSAVEKRERLITDEASMEDQMLLINLDDMVECQQEGWDEVNRIFGTNVRVYIDEDYDPKFLEEEETVTEEVSIDE